MKTEESEPKYIVFLSKRDMTEYVISHAISKEEYAQVLEADTFLKFANDNEKAWRILHVNIGDNAKFGKTLMEGVISKGVSLSKDNLELTEKVLNVQLFNILSSFYFYSEFSKTQFSRFFGNDSIQLVELKKIFSH